MSETSDDDDVETGMGGSSGESDARGVCTGRPQQIHMDVPAALPLPWDGRGDAGGEIGDATASESSAGGPTRHPDAHVTCRVQEMAAKRSGDDGPERNEVHVLGYMFDPQTVTRLACLGPWKTWEGDVARWASRLMMPNALLCLPCSAQDVRPSSDGGESPLSPLAASPDGPSAHSRHHEATLIGAGQPNAAVAQGTDRGRAERGDAMANTGIASGNALSSSVEGTSFLSFAHSPPFEEVAQVL